MGLQEDKVHLGAFEEKLPGFLPLSSSFRGIGEGFVLAVERECIEQGQGDPLSAGFSHRIDQGPMRFLLWSRRKGEEGNEMSAVAIG